MERSEIRDDNGHVIDITSIQQNENIPSTSVSDPVFQHSGYTDHPLNSAGFWISCKFVITICQIIAAIVLLFISTHEHPRAPLLTWVISFVSGCVATLFILFWRFYYRNDQYTTTSAVYTRLEVVVDYFEIGLDCLFLVWIIVGDVWNFLGNSSASDAPNVYRLCLTFIYITCFGNVMPLIMSVTIRCCFHLRADLTQNRGATTESINSLPTYKFKIKKHNKHGNNNGPQESTTESGVVAAGTNKESALSGEDAMCCICLAKYVDNDELRQLMCTHFFHKDCVDKWLKINASCPLCKSEVVVRVL